MSKRQGLLFLGIFTVILPFLGIPYAWKYFFTVVVGLGLIAVSYFMKRDEKPIEDKNSTPVFVENTERAE